MGQGKGTATEAVEEEMKGHAQEKFRKEGRFGWFGTRHYVTLMLFLGMANAYVMRTNMSVAIVAMVNHTAYQSNNNEPIDDECDSELGAANSSRPDPNDDGSYLWDTDDQGYILSSFFYGYVITQIPFGIMAKKYGNIHFLGYGMLINSVFAFLVPIAADYGMWWLIAVRFIQGLGEGPITPCTHALLAKWIPPNERSRMGAFVYAGAQFGTIISMPLSGLLSETDWQWPSIFYVFGAVGTIWSLLFVFAVYEDPEQHPHIDPDERKHIISSVWGSSNTKAPPIPWRKIFMSVPFWGILIAHIGHNYGYETLMTELPTYMKQVLHFNIKDNGFLSSLPYLAMWIFSMVASLIADWLLNKGYFNLTTVRKFMNGLGQYGSAVALIAVSWTGCDRWLTVAILTIGVGLNGGIYSGFKVNHLDISPRFAGIMMSITNCTANLAGLLAPMFAGNIIAGGPTQAKWRIVFLTAAAVYIICCTVYMFCASGEKQPWDNHMDDQHNGADIETSATNGGLVLNTTTMTTLTILPHIEQQQPETIPGQSS